MAAPERLRRRDAAAAKPFPGGAVVQSSLDEVRRHGGYGYTAEYEVGRDLCAAVGSRL